MNFASIVPKIGEQYATQNHFPRREDTPSMDSMSPEYIEAVIRTKSRTMSQKEKELNFDNKYRKEYGSIMLRMWTGFAKLYLPGESTC
jgi:hypothetical protein